MPQNLLLCHINTMYTTPYNLIQCQKYVIITLYRQSTSMAQHNTSLSFAEVWSPLLYALNVSDMTSKFCVVAMFVILELQNIFHAQCSYMFMVHSLNDSSTTFRHFGAPRTIEPSY
jgi:hypothetical protein